jgi:hypothetical protein
VQQAQFQTALFHAAVVLSSTNSDPKPALNVPVGEHTIQLATLIKYWHCFTKNANIT